MADLDYRLTDKPEPPPWRKWEGQPTKRAKQQTLFRKKGLPGQLDLFQDHPEKPEKLC